MSVKQEVVLSDAVARMVELQVASGRYADFSSAVQDAAWNYFFGSPSIFEEYDVSPEEVARSAKKDREEAARAKKEGTAKVWQ